MRGAWYRTEVQVHCTGTVELYGTRSNGERERELKAYFLCAYVAVSKSSFCTCTEYAQGLFPQHSVLAYVQANSVFADSFSSCLPGRNRQCQFGRLGLERFSPLHYMQKYIISTKIL